MLSQDEKIRQAELIGYKMPLLASVTIAAPVDVYPFNSFIELDADFLQEMARAYLALSRSLGEAGVSSATLAFHRVGQAHLKETLLSQAASESQT